MMSARADRILTRLWLALATPPVLALCLHLGALVGAGRWPDLVPVSVAAAVHGAAPSPGAREPAASSPVEGCNRHVIDETNYPHPDED